MDAIHGSSAGPDGDEPSGPKHSRVRFGAPADIKLDLDRVARIRDEFVEATRALAQAQSHQMAVLAELQEVVLECERGPQETAVMLRSVATECAVPAGLSDRTVLTLMGSAHALCYLFPDTFTALADGQVSLPHVRVIVDEAAALTPVQRAQYEAKCLVQAVETTPGRLVKKARAIAESLQPRSVDERHYDAAAARTVWVKDLPDGMAELGAILPAVLAYAAKSRIDRIAKSVKLRATQDATARRQARPTPVPASALEPDELNPRTKLPANYARLSAAAQQVARAEAQRLRDAEAVWSLDTLRADAFAEILLTGTLGDTAGPGRGGILGIASSTDSTGSANGADDTNNAGATGATGATDAIDAIVTAINRGNDGNHGIPGEAHRAGGESPMGAAGPRGPGSQHIPKISTSALPTTTSQVASGIQASISITIPSGGTATLDGYGPIDTITARQFAAVAPGWDHTIVEADGAVLTTDRRQPTEAMRRILIARDGRCRFPGCSVSTSSCEIDHTIEWAQGGSTTIGNLAHLCPKHHLLKHPDLKPELRWSVTQDADGILTWTSPTGDNYVDRPERRYRTKTNVQADRVGSSDESRATSGAGSSEHLSRFGLGFGPGPGPGSPPGLDVDSLPDFTTLP